MATQMKLFLNPLAGRERYLNRMAEKGFRLLHSGSILHRFEKTQEPLHYSVQYIGHMNSRERLDYVNFLQGLNMTLHYAPLNLGKFAFGNLRWRPYNKPSSSLASTSGMMNKEILIIESTGEKEIPVFTDKSSQQDDLRIRRGPYFYLALAAVVFILLGALKLQGNLISWTYYSFRPLDQYPWIWIVVGALMLLVALFGILRLNILLGSKHE